MFALNCSPSQRLTPALPQTRCAAAECLKTLGPTCHTAASEQLLLQCLSDASLELQSQIFSVLSCLDALNAPAILDRLIDLLKSDDADLRLHALATLSFIPMPGTHTHTTHTHTTHAGSLSLGHSILVSLYSSSVFACLN